MRWLVAVISFLLANPGYAFGVDPPENNVGAEHQRITRAAVPGLGSSTLDRLAGPSNRPSAIEAAEATDTQCRGPEEAVLTGEEARSFLEACRAFVLSELTAAVLDAGPLADSAPADATVDCAFDGSDAGAKCKVLFRLGRAFHAAQDFYARSNWVDRSASGSSADDDVLPGLGHRARALWFDPRRDEAFPQGLAIGAGLNKDRGPIGQGSGGVGITRQGETGGNFARAVSAAVDDTRDKWDYFQEQVRTRYGVAPGEKILCALTQDRSDATACAVRAQQAQACASRRARYVDGSTEEPLAPPSVEETRRADVLLEKLRQFCSLEEATLRRDAVIRGKTAEDGAALARQSGVEALALWDACPREARSYLDVFGSEHKTQLQQLQPDDTKAIAARSTLYAAAYADCIVDARLRLEPSVR